MPFPVTLHVYDVTNQNVTKYLNKVCKDSANVGGAFHGGVEVCDIEYSFGGTSEGTGVFMCEPRMCSSHRYRESIYMGDTQMTVEELAAMVEAMSAEWDGPSYNLLSRNCCSFSDEFCVRLGVGNTPAWVNKFATIGASARDLGNSKLGDANRAMEASGIRTKATRLATGIHAGISGGLAGMGKFMRK
ncbi:DeSI-like protein [Diplonema papillatum]|nr:DeSI-like protein [Diplonema papillatum]